MWIAGYEVDEVGSLAIACVPAFTDNYHWLVKAGDAVAVVDPGDGEACLKAAGAIGWTITHVLATHWHPDHVGGNLAVKDATGAAIHGPAPEADKIPGIDHQLTEGDTLRLGDADARVWHVPGHTNGHIAYLFDDDGAAFVGDHLFAMGCGRMFEGNAPDMYAALTRFSDLPDTMKLYCAHEYTLANGEFAAHAFPDSDAIADRLAAVRALREDGRRTVPTDIGRERATNPFLMARDHEDFARLRAAKDHF